MKPLPDLDDVQAMAQTGRRSVLMRARNEACEALRDAVVGLQAADIADAIAPAKKAIEQAARLIEVANLWRITNGEPVGEDATVPLLQASLVAVKK